MTLERLSPKQFEQFSEFIYTTSGIRIDSKKITLLSNRIRRRLSKCGVDSFDAYYHHLRSPAGASELSGFLDAITTNETFFFRTPSQFEWLKSDWLNEQIMLQQAGKRSDRLRIWSAGCANGAEPYSIAMCIAENLYRLRQWSVEILGTDISQEMLAEAARGTYRDRSVDGLSEPQRRRYFRHDQQQDLWQLRDTIRAVVDFKKHNLMRPILSERFDCIFIRNVLIYFDFESKKRAVQHLLNSLEVGGYLVVGPSEGIYELLHSLRRVSPLIYQKTDHQARVGGPSA
ncbi:MAG: CheR family methyltransferase [Rubripirellula sp.]